MKDGKKWLIVFGGVVAIVAHWLTGYWLDVIGGAIAVLAVLLMK